MIQCNVLYLVKYLIFNVGNAIQNTCVILPAEAMCSEVLTGWKPTNGICIEQRRPMMKKVL